MQHRKFLTLLDILRKTRTVFGPKSPAVTYGLLMACIAATLNRRLVPFDYPNLVQYLPRPGCGVLQPAAVADLFVFD